MSSKINYLIFRSLLFTLFVITAVQVHADIIESDVVVSTVIAADRTGLELVIMNQQSNDMFCPQVNVTMEFCNSNFCEVVGQTMASKKNVYVPAHSDKTLSVQNTTDTIRTHSPKAIINRIKDIDVSSCRPADFKSYCEYAKKTEEELYTISLLTKYERGNRCDLNIEEVHSLKLKNKGVTNLTPLKYLFNLERLNLSKNNIKDLSSLYGLTSLWNIKLNDTPVVSLEQILKIPNISRIYAKRTMITDINLNQEFPLSLKFVQLDRGSKVCALEKISTRELPFELSCF